MLREKKSRLENIKYGVILNWVGGGVAKLIHKFIERLKEIQQIVNYG